MNTEITKDHKEEKSSPTRGIRKERKPEKIFVSIIQMRPQGELIPLLKIIVMKTVEVTQNHR